MMLLIRLTLVLAMGAAALAVLPRHAVKVRHAVCALTVLASLLLPFPFAAPIIPVRVAFVATVLPGPVSPMSTQSPWKLLWVAGSVVVLIRFCVGVAYVSYKTHKAKGDGEIRYAAVDSPQVWGWIRPTILMPETAAQWTRERWSIAIAHERAHVERGDIWTSTLAVLAEALYWFHPLMWWMTRRMREEQEMACDERVLERGSDGIAYAELLMETAGLPESGLLGCRMTGGKMKLRLERILEWQRAARWGRTKQWAALLACTLCLVTGAMLRAATTQNGPYKIGGDVTAPVLVEKHEPGYTKSAKDAKIQGPVVLSITISDQGVPEDVHVTKSLDPGLDEKAMQAVSSWRFKPALKDGKPVSVLANVEVQFRLK